MKKKMIRTAGALTGAAAMLSGYAQQAVAETAEVKVDALNATVSVREAGEYAKVSNVAGEFTFNQDVICPSDEVFNLFGTVATAMCARPGFAFDAVNEEDYYLNFGGSVLKTQSISLAQLKQMQSEQRTLKCSCATGPAVANAQVVGVPLSNILQMVDLEEGANTVTFKCGDGYGVSMPLSYALEKDAILVYQVGGTPVPTGTQIWVPKSVARYFARNVVDIEFSVQEKEPAVLEADAAQRAKVTVLNHFDDSTFAVGDQIQFEGYADDFDKAITAVEFSMDGGETWTACTTEGATADKWVYWTFSYVTEAAGTYKLDVRARAEDGTVSPMAAGIEFIVK